MDIKEDLPQWSTNFVIKKSRDTTTYTGTGIISENRQLANELHRPINRKFKKRKILESPMRFKNFWMAIVVNQTRYGWIRAVSFTTDN